MRLLLPFLVAIALLGLVPDVSYAESDQAWSELTVGMPMSVPTLTEAQPVALSNSTSIDLPFGIPKTLPKAPTIQSAVKQVFTRISEAISRLSISIATNTKSVPVGGKVTAFVTLVNNWTRPMGDIKVDIIRESSNQRLETVASVDIPSLEPGDENTLEVPVTSPTGGASRISAVVRTKNAKYERSCWVVFDGPGWYRGDCHTHSVFSDGSGTVEENIAAAKDAGLTWIITTDHDTLDQARAIPKADSPDFLSLYGEEIDLGGHAIVFNIDRCFTANGVSTLDPEMATAFFNHIKMTADSPYGHGKPLIFAAHPLDAAYPFSNLSDIKGYDGMEALRWIGTVREAKRVLAKLDELNDEGSRGRLYATTVSDAHFPSMIGSYFTAVYMEKLSTRNLMKSMSSGSFFGSNGPSLEFSINGSIIGSSVPVDKGGSEVTLRMSATYHKSIVTRVRLFKSRQGLDGRYGADVIAEWKPNSSSWDSTLCVQAKPGDFFRLEVEAGRSRFAYSNPVWIVSIDQ